MGDGLRLSSVCEEPLRLYDPSYEADWVFSSSEKLIGAHRGRIGELSIYGEESNSTANEVRADFDDGTKDLAEALVVDAFLDRHSRSRQADPWPGHAASMVRGRSR